MMRITNTVFLLCLVLALVSCESNEDEAQALSSESASSIEQLPIPEGANPERWEEDIGAFELADQEEAPAKGGIVFVGSSSIRLWSTLADDMAPLPVVQRGFGGSRLFDAIYYTDRIITPYEPGMLVVFSGTNDISGDNPKPAQEVVALYNQFTARVHERFADLPIYFIAISPTRSRWQHREIVFETNRRIADIASTDDRLFFIDTASALLTEAGEPNDDLFVDDQLHLNADGYAVWTSIIKPVLVQGWEQIK